MRGLFYTGRLAWSFIDAFCSRSRSPAATSLPRPAALCVGRAGVLYCGDSVGEPGARNGLGSGLRRPLAAVQRHRDAALAALGHDDRIHAPHHQRAIVLLRGWAAGVDVYWDGAGTSGACGVDRSGCVHACGSNSRGAAGEAGVDRAEPVTAARSLSCVALDQHTFAAGGAYADGPSARPALWLHAKDHT